MKIIHFIRGLFVLILTPVLTFFSSLLALIALLVLRISAENAQVIPRYWAQIILAASGVKVTVNGMETLEPGKPYIFASNHQSQFDIFSMQGCFQSDFRWMAKKELFAVPLFGHAMRLAGCIPVDRSHGRKAMKSLVEAAERIASGTSVVIFPEGTRSRDGRLYDFKTGGMVLAIKSGVPVVPVAICGTFEVLPKGSLFAKPGRVTIRVGKPIDTSDYTVKQKQELAERLHDEVAKLLAEG
ncbi:MAG: 1-acyl-sn-glycerol-3-phosphate acyltransferase [Desulfobulbaceae bacterium]|uniref:1-acyl-sn-glycerol-3-phosphate acyltransferase n=1 Tax=Candidatus Desulfobia pelagia TaxID=2841692 RepID=A0A8J6NA44_9BACT|nr:1-acyl-sn-glycerol-3-phosphate acyltransferase [Candidatus Desulfobia pelagia]